MKKVFSLFAAVLLISCSSRGFNRGALKEQLGVDKPVVTDKEIVAVLNKKANLPKPFHMALYFKEQRTGHHGANQNWRWDAADKELIVSSIKNSDLDKSLKEISVVPSSNSEDIKALRLAAAQQGADALLVVSGISDVDTYCNNAAWSYLLLVPAFFVKGNEADSLFIAQASLYDVRNEFLYFNAEAESEKKFKYPGFLGPNDKKLVSEAKNIAIKELSTEVIKMIAGRKTSDIN